jgi:hypothetical protein
LYRVPEEIRALEGKSQEKVASDDLLPVALPGSLGIAEVALPSRYKEANVRATEEARRSLEESTGDIYLKYIANSKADLFSSGLKDMQSLLGGKRELSHAMVGMSTDDKTFLKFRKMTNGRR